MIAIVDYGRGNLGSVEKAFARVGMPAQATQDPAVVDDAEAVVLPGAPQAQTHARLQPGPTATTARWQACSPACNPALAGGGAWSMEISAGAIVVCLAAVFLIAFMRGRLAAGLPSSAFRSCRW